MQLPNWKSLISADEERFSEAKLQFASALQWVAYIERSYVQSDNPDELFLHWLDERGIISTHDFAGTYGLGLHVNDLMMQFTASGVPEDHKIELDERSPAEVEAWILSELLHRGIDRSKFAKKLPYDLTDLMSGDDLDFSPREYEAELTKLFSLLQNAAHNMCNAAVELGLAEKDNCTFRISPQNLNLEIDLPNYVFGFSFNDKLDDDSPYFYTMRTSRGEISYSDKRTLKVSNISKDATAQEVLNFLQHETIPN